MKVAYLFISPVNISLNAVLNIVSQLEGHKPGLEVVGMCFFDENSIFLNPDSPLGIKLNQLSKDMDITLMTGSLTNPAGKNGFDGPTSQPLKIKSNLTPAQRPVVRIANGQEIACLPDIYAALSAKLPDRLISV